MAGDDILIAPIRRLAGAGDDETVPDDVLAGRAVDALAAAAPDSERATRLYGVLRRPLERRAGRRPSGATPEEALAERLEDRLAAIVVAMEDAREAGDVRGGELDVAGVEGIGTPVVARLVR